MKTLELISLTLTWHNLLVAEIILKRVISGSNLMLNLVQTALEVIEPMVGLPNYHNQE